MMWLLDLGVPIISVGLLAIFEMLLRNRTRIQFVTSVLIVLTATLIFRFLLMWITA